METSQKLKHELLRGSIYMLLSCFFASFMNGMVKATAHYTSSTIIILFSQFLIGLLFLLPIIFTGKKRTTLGTQHIVKHILRGVAGGSAAFCLFLAIQLSSMTTAVLLVYAAPLWMTLFAWAFFKEKISSRMWIGVIIGFIGVALILNPDKNTFNIGILVAILGGILMAVAFLTVRLLNTTEPTLRIVFYYFVVSVIFSLPWFLYDVSSNWHPIPLIGWLLIAGVGIGQAFCQIFLVLAYRHATPARLAPYIYTIIVFTVLIDYIIWGQALNPLGYVGIILVIIGGLLVTMKFFAPAVD